MIMKTMKTKKINIFGFLKRTYSSQGMVYLSNEDPTDKITDIVKWLDNITVKTYSQKKADKMMFDFFNNKYPNYKGKIKLF